MISEDLEGFVLATGNASIGPRVAWQISRQGGEGGTHAEFRSLFEKFL